MSKKYRQLTKKEITVWNDRFECLVTELEASDASTADVLSILENVEDRVSGSAQAIKEDVEAGRA